MPPRPSLQLQLTIALLLGAAAGASVTRLPGNSNTPNVIYPNFGDWCDENEDCAINDNSLECRNKQCVCRQGFEFTDGFCKKGVELLPSERLPRLGEWCESGDDCAAVGDHLECRNAVCACTQGRVLLNGSCQLSTAIVLTTTIRSPRLGDLCEESLDCELVDENMECRTGVCMCKEGYSLLNGSCAKVSGTVLTTTGRIPHPGDVCEENEDCAVADENLECRAGVCHCKEGHALQEGSCQVLPRPATATASIAPTTTLIAAAPTTRRPSRLGDWCMMNEDCGEADGNLECFGGVCLCKQGYVPDDGLCDKDIPAVETTAAATTAATTTTTTSTTPRPRPVRPPQIGDWCVDSLDCARTDHNMECFSEVCLCKQGYVQREGLCRMEIQGGGAHWSWAWEKAAASSVGTLCEEWSDCPTDEHLECRRGYCECVGGFSEHEGACKRMIRKIGSACNDTTDVCYLEDDEGDQKTACVQGKCLCKREFILDDGRCKKYINKLGERCHPDLHICFLKTDVNDTNSECRDQTCQCKPGYEEIDGLCTIVIVNKELGANCQNDESCSNILNAKCSDKGKCACREGYGPMNNRSCGKRVGDRCDNGVCDAFNTQCTKKRSNQREISVCACKKFHISSSNRTYCYTWPQSVGDLCDITSNCMFLGESVECIEGRCQCGGGLAHQDGVCL